ncbi:MAG: hypothetical protein GEEBNDBF_01352 [bacterium]|nr:hypothetical protein [bacterium]
MSSNRRSSLRGFTMLEILVVATIVAILITMGLSSYRNSRQRTIEVAGFHGLKAIGAGMEAYHTSHGRYAANFRELQNYSIIAQAYRQSDPRGPAGGIDAFMRGFSVTWVYDPAQPHRYSVIARGVDYPYNERTGDNVIFLLTQEGIVYETRQGTSGSGGTYVPAH